MSWTTTRDNVRKGPHAAMGALPMLASHVEGLYDGQEIQVQKEVCSCVKYLQKVGQ